MSLPMKTWDVWFRSVLSKIKYKDWYFYLGEDGDRRFLQVKFMGVCNVTGKPATHYCRKWFLSPHMTRSEVVQTAFMAVMAAEEHEAREKFKYRGASIFNPHYDVDKLFELHFETKNFDARNGNAVPGGDTLLVNPNVKK